MPAMTNRERFHALMGLKPVDRLPVVEWAPWWDKTLHRWHQEGLPADLTTTAEVQRHFGLDVLHRHHFPTRRDPPGRRLPEVRSARDYEAVRPRLFPRPAVDERMWAAWADEQARGESVVCAWLDGFFWFPRTLMGIERHLLAFYDQPALMHRMNADLVEHNARLLDELCAVCRPDFVAFAEDMSYNHGPMISEGMFDEFLLPYYRVLLPAIAKRGILSFIDSDGDVTEAAGWFERAGLEGLLPLERRSGVDVAGLRRRHPRMRLLGGFDKTVMHLGEPAIRAEFDRLLPVASAGGFLVSCDHQTPPEVSYQDYRLFVRLFREFAARAGGRGGRSA